MQNAVTAEDVTDAFQSISQGTARLMQPVSLCFQDVKSLHFYGDEGARSLFHFSVGKEGEKSQLEGIDGVSYGKTFFKNRGKT